MSTRQNYIAKMETRKQAKIDAGLVSERFPTVAGIVIGMTYYHNAENPILMQRTVNIFPTSNAFFNMECMIKTCEGGGFDLTWWTVDGGGGTISGSGYTLEGTAGQPDAGQTLSGGGYTLGGGFWSAGGALQFNVYLPVIVRSVD